MRRLAGVAVVVLACVSLANTAQAYDRSPIRGYGLVPDTWGMSISNAEQKLRARFGGISADYCVGVIIVGHESDSSWVSGTTRYWDKLACAGYTRAGHTFGLIIDAKGHSADSWTIYRLKGVTLAALQ
jgi:hypothetical protein